MIYYLHKTTPLDNISSKDRQAISRAYQEALLSDFKTFKLGAVLVNQSKVYV